MYMCMKYTEIGRAGDTGISEGEGRYLGTSSGERRIS